VYESDNVDVFNNVAYMNNQNSQLSQQGYISIFASFSHFSAFLSSTSTVLKILLGELTAFNSGNVRFFNNLVYTHASGMANNVNEVTYVFFSLFFSLIALLIPCRNVIFNNNLYFNYHTITSPDPTDITGVDPQFVNPTLNGT
jgi:hypothetical protein